MTRSFIVHITELASGRYHAACVQLAGVWAGGTTREEALAALRPRIQRALTNGSEVAGEVIVVAVEIATEEPQKTHGERETS